MRSKSMPKLPVIQESFMTSSPHTLLDKGRKNYKINSKSGRVVIVLKKPTKNVYSRNGIQSC